MRRKFFDSEKVMEIKSHIEVPDDFINKFLPYQDSRFSKYCRGLLMTGITI